MDTQWTQALWLTMLFATRVGACSQGRNSEWEDAGSELELLRAVLLRERDRPVSVAASRVSLTPHRACHRKRIEVIPDAEDDMCV